MATEKPKVSGPTRVAIVPHTHWDREWHEPFARTRLRLVDALDRVLHLLDADERACFLLDGQTAVVDDYLEARPEQAERLAAHVRGGRLQVGPWAVLADELVVSGETLVRNLQTGIRRAAALGAVTAVGYLPDEFGHTAQMPQLLRLAGIEHSVVWRGVPAALERTAFWWLAPDGSRVRAEHLYGSYANGRDLPREASALVGRARAYQQELGSARRPDEPLLLMNGADHAVAQLELGPAVEAANAAQDDYRFEITTLARYLEAAPVEHLPEWRGELGSSARAPVLRGVASNRVDVHRAVAVAERALEQRAEPLAALFMQATDSPARVLEAAWRDVVANSAHDSACATAIDPVVETVLVRARTARDAAEGIVDAVLGRIGATVDAPEGSIVVVNPTPRPRGGLVHVTVSACSHGRPVVVAPDGTRGSAQGLAARRPDGMETVLRGNKILWVAELVGERTFGGMPVREVHRLGYPDGGLELTFFGAAPDEEPIELDAVRAELFTIAARDGTARVRVVRPPVVDIAFCADVAAFGWTVYDLEYDDAEERSGAPRGRSGSIENAHLRVEVDETTGTFDVHDKIGGVAVPRCGRLVDGGDGGDTYNYSPPDEDRLIDRAETVHVRAREGTHVSRAHITATYRWPTHAVGDERSCSARSTDTELVTVRTTLELRSGERFLRVHVDVDNPCRDHRLRAHFPLPARVDGSSAEAAFCVVERGLEAEGGIQEPALPTFVSRRFVDCSNGDVGLAVLHDGLLEYEVVEDGAELALTLLRAVGFLSRACPALRPLPAGPLRRVDGAQMPGRHVADYALLPHRGDCRAADLYAAADAFLVPLEAFVRSGETNGTRGRSGSELRVEGAEVSAVLRDAGRLTVRCFNPSSVPTTLTVSRADVPARGEVVDLTGHVVRTFDGALALRGHEIVTLRLREH